MSKINPRNYDLVKKYILEVLPDVRKIPKGPDRGAFYLRVQKSQAYEQISKGEWVTIDQIIEYLVDGQTLSSQLLSPQELLELAKEKNLAQDKIDEYTTKFGLPGETGTESKSEQTQKPVSLLDALVKSNAFKIDQDVKIKAALLAQTAREVFLSFPHNQVVPEKSTITNFIDSLLQKNRTKQAQTDNSRSGETFFHIKINGEKRNKADNETIEQFLNRLLSKNELPDSERSELIKIIPPLLQQFAIRGFADLLGINEEDRNRLVYAEVNFILPKAEDQPPQPAKLIYKIGVHTKFLPEKELMAAGLEAVFELRDKQVGENVEQRKVKKVNLGVVIPNTKSEVESIASLPVQDTAEKETSLSDEQIAVYKKLIAYAVIQWKEGYGSDLLSGFLAALKNHRKSYDCGLVVKLAVMEQYQALLQGSYGQGQKLNVNPAYAKKVKIQAEKQFSDLIVLVSDVSGAEQELKLKQAVACIDYFIGEGFKFSPVSLLKIAADKLGVEIKEIPVDLSEEIRKYANVFFGLINNYLKQKVKLSDINDLRVPTRLQVELEKASRAFYDKLFQASAIDKRDTTFVKLSTPSFTEKFNNYIYNYSCDLTKLFKIYQKTGDRDELNRQLNLRNFELHEKSLVTKLFIEDYPRGGRAYVQFCENNEVKTFSGEPKDDLSEFVENSILQCLISLISNQEYTNQQVKSLQDNLRLNGYITNLKFADRSFKFNLNKKEGYLDVECQASISELQWTSPEGKPVQVINKPHLAVSSRFKIHFELVSGITYFNVEQVTSGFDFLAVSDPSFPVRFKFASQVLEPKLRLTSISDLSDGFNVEFFKYIDSSSVGIIPAITSVGTLIRDMKGELPQDEQKLCEDLYKNLYSQDTVDYIKIGNDLAKKADELSAKSSNESDKKRYINLKLFALGLQLNAYNIKFLTNKIEDEEKQHVTNLIDQICEFVSLPEVEQQLTSKFRDELIRFRPLQYLARFVSPETESEHFSSEIKLVDYYLAEFNAKFLTLPEDLQPKRFPNGNQLSELQKIIKKLESNTPGVCLEVGKRIIEFAEGIDSVGFSESQINQIKDLKHYGYILQLHAYAQSLNEYAFLLSARVVEIQKFIDKFKEFLKEKTLDQSSKICETQIRYLENFIRKQINAGNVVSLSEDKNTCQDLTWKTLEQLFVHNVYLLKYNELFEHKKFLLAKLIKEKYPQTDADDIPLNEFKVRLASGKVTDKEFLSYLFDPSVYGEESTSKSVVEFVNKIVDTLLASNESEAKDIKVLINFGCRLNDVFTIFNVTTEAKNSILEKVKNSTAEFERHLTSAAMQDQDAKLLKSLWLKFEEKRESYIRILRNFNRTAVLQLSALNAVDEVGKTDHINKHRLNYVSSLVPKDEIPKLQLFVKDSSVIIKEFEAVHDAVETKFLKFLLNVVKRYNEFFDEESPKENLELIQLIILKCKKSLSGATSEINSLLSVLDSGIEKYGINIFQNLPVRENLAAVAGKKLLESKGKTFLTALIAEIQENAKEETAFDYYLVLILLLQKDVLKTYKALLSHLYNLLKSDDRYVDKAQEIIDKVNHWVNGEAGISFDHSDAVTGILKLQCAPRIAELLADFFGHQESAVPEVNVPEPIEPIEREAPIFSDDYKKIPAKLGVKDKTKLYKDFDISTAEFISGDTHLITFLQALGNAVDAQNVKTKDSGTEIKKQISKAKEIYNIFITPRESGVSKIRQRRYDVEFIDVIRNIGKKITDPNLQQAVSVFELALQETALVTEETEKLPVMQRYNKHKGDELSYGKILTNVFLGDKKFSEQLLVGDIGNLVKYNAESAKNALRPSLYQYLFKKWGAISRKFDKSPESMNAIVDILIKQPEPELAQKVLNRGWNIFRVNYAEGLTAKHIARMLKEGTDSLRKQILLNQRLVKRLLSPRSSEEQVVYDSIAEWMGAAVNEKYSSELVHSLLLNNPKFVFQMIKFWKDSNRADDLTNFFRKTLALTNINEAERNAFVKLKNVLDEKKDFWDESLQQIFFKAFWSSTSEFKLEDKLRYEKVCKQLGVVESLPPGISIRLVPLIENMDHAFDHMARIARKGSGGRPDSPNNPNYNTKEPPTTGINVTNAATAESQEDTATPPTDYVSMPPSPR